MGYTTITSPHLETPADKLFVFVSHLWSDDDWYVKLIELLNKCLKDKWENHSIPKRDDINYDLSGFDLEQKIDLLQHERNLRIEHRIKSINKVIESIPKDILGDHVLEEEEKTAHKRICELEQKGAGEILINAEKKYQSDRIKVIKDKLFHPDRKKFYPDREKKIKKINELKSEIQQLQGEMTAVKLQLGESIDNQIFYTGKDRYYYNDYSYDEFNKQRNYGNFSYGSSRIIELEIYNRIMISDLIILIASMYSQYKRWMDYELRMAHRFKVPVIAILPQNQDRFPLEIKMQCENLLTWEKDEISKIIKEMLVEKLQLHGNIERLL